MSGLDLLKEFLNGPPTRTLWDDVKVTPTVTSVVSSRCSCSKCQKGSSFTDPWVFVPLDRISNTISIDHLKSLKYQVFRPDTFSHKLVHTIFTLDDDKECCYLSTSYPHVPPDYLSQFNVDYLKNILANVTRNCNTTNCITPALNGRKYCPYCIHL